MIYHNYLKELEDHILDDYGRLIFFYRKWATSEMIGSNILGTWEFINSILTLQLNLNNLEGYVNEHEKNHARGHNEEEVRRIDSIKYPIEELFRYKHSYN